MTTTVGSSNSARRLDASQAECLVFTFKEGVLSAIAHDLKIRATGIEVEVGAGPASVRARIEARSLRVVCARQGQSDAPSVLSERDRQTIERNIVDDVLEAKRHPHITFTSSAIELAGDRAEVRGTLELHGSARPLTLSARREGDRWVADVRLHQPDFGIKPFSAMLGTLKIKPDVELRLSLPA